MGPKLAQELKETLYLHRPLDVSQYKTAERIRANQQNEDSKTYSIDMSRWYHTGVGEVIVSSNTYKLVSPTRYETYPDTYPEDGDYVNYGENQLCFPINYEDFSKFNQLRLTISSDCVNVVNPNITISFKNEGEITIPDVYNREGHHVINLETDKSSEYVLDISNLPRERISEIRLSVGINGSYHNLPGQVEITVGNLRLEAIPDVLVCEGWQPSEQEIVFSHIGYLTAHKKTAIINEELVKVEKTFELRRSLNNELVLSKKIYERATTIGSFGVLDFSEVNEAGEYYLTVGEIKTEKFRIGSAYALHEESIWKSLNFIFCERCGYNVPGIHGSCHHDVYATFKDRKISFNGGWHDAGDLSQQLIQTAEVTASLFELAAKLRFKSPTLSKRLIEEGEWGVDFILKTRLGDGWRVTSAGVTRWTDNQLGNMDDANARVHNSPFDNFLITGILAKIYLTLPTENQLKKILYSILAVDFKDAYEKFVERPFFHEPVFWEHTYSTSKSLFLSVMIWSASLMYQVSKSEYYNDLAKKWFVELKKCQETVGISLEDKTKIRGWFYRDETQTTPQHFNHQAREHLYAESVAIFMENNATQDIGVEAREVLEQYSEYLMSLQTYTEPYPMIASGVYHKDEQSDDINFYKQHLLIGEEAKTDYQNQLSQGVNLTDCWYLKRFPVWFSFRGNNAVVLSMAKSAGICGNHLNKPELLEIAHEQLQWLIGKNPFNQSMMFGVGYNYTQQYSVSSGEMVGELPVGIQTRGNSDLPYWPQFNNATYKEVWVGLAGKYQAVISELLDS